VHKLSVGKPSTGGRKNAVRQFDDRGVAAAEHLGSADAEGQRGDRALQVPVIRDGNIVGDHGLGAARERCRASLAELPVEAMKLSPGEPAIPTLMELNGTTEGKAAG
jgi:nicotinate phosphoribosyltransferase